MGRNRKHLRLGVDYDALYADIRTYMRYDDDMIRQIARRANVPEQSLIELMPQLAEEYLFYKAAETVRRHEGLQGLYDDFLIYDPREWIEGPPRRQSRTGHEALTVLYYSLRSWWCGAPAWNEMMFHSHDQWPKNAPALFFVAVAQALDQRVQEPHCASVWKRVGTNPFRKQRRSRKS